MQKPTLPGYHSEEEQAARLGVGLATLRKWRRLGVGPRATVIGRRHLYSEAAEADWLKAQEVGVEKPERRRYRGRAA